MKKAYWAVNKISWVTKVVFVHKGKVEMSDFNLEVSERANVWNELDTSNKIGISIWSN